MEVVLALPVQVLIAIIAVLAKPLGGFRTIALLGMVYRLWARVRKLPVAEWEDSFVGALGHCGQRVLGVARGSGQGLCS